MTNERVTTLRVGKDTDVRRLAGAIRRSFLDDNVDSVEITSIGAGATNQAVKAVATAKRFFDEEGYSVKMIPSYKTIDVDNRQITAIVSSISIEKA